MKGSFSCRRCGRWLEGEWSDASAAEQVELQRQMEQGICDVCPNPPRWPWFLSGPGQQELARAAVEELVELMEQPPRCPCFYFEADPDLTTDPAVEVCACGHTDDEHNDQGECQVAMNEE